MSEYIQLLLAIGVILNAIAGIGGVVIGLLTLGQSKNNGALSSKVALVNNKLAKDMAELAVNTNSIRDQLVASTAKASFGEGVDSERMKQEERGKTK